MEKLNLASFGQREKLSHHSKLKITLNILVVLYIKEFVAVEIITYVKPSETQLQEQITRTTKR